MIRKEIKEDGSFGGNYPFDIEYANLPSNLIEITEEQRDYIDANLDKLRYINGTITDISQTPEYIAEQERKEQERKAQRKITKRQMLFWLYLNKQKTESDILNAINAIPDETQKYLAGVSYNGTNDFYYGNEFVPIIGLALGLAVQDLDKMFDEAVEL